MFSQIRVRGLDRQTYQGGNSCWNCCTIRRLVSIFKVLPWNKAYTIEAHIAIHNAG